jgi:hypothetical protein
MRRVTDAFFPSRKIVVATTDDDMTMTPDRRLGRKLTLEEVHQRVLDLLATKYHNDQKYMADKHNITVGYLRVFLKGYRDPTDWLQRELNIRKVRETTFAFYEFADPDDAKRTSN